jgi:anthranilate phosphoribosyltransferase
MIDNHTQFATYVATLGRGPGRSRALTREEARSAFGMVLRGEADPHQIGAFLMLLRFRGEDAEEITGIVQAARDHAGISEIPTASSSVDLDWPSYGAGRTRGAPWFLLSALALARSGISVLMHGSNDFSSGISVGNALGFLGMQSALALSVADSRSRLQHDRFAYIPLQTLDPVINRLLGMRHLFGLRSPVNTATRLLDPGHARSGVDGVFHPPYIEVHLGVAERMQRPRLLVLKGGGGEAERNPRKPMGATLWDQNRGRAELLLPAVAGLSQHVPAHDTPHLLAAVWHGEASPDAPLAIVQATIAVALLALDRATNSAQAMIDAKDIWAQRL